MWMYESTNLAQNRWPQFLPPKRVDNTRETQEQDMALARECAPKNIYVLQFLLKRGGMEKMTC